MGNRTGKAIIVQTRLLADIPQARGCSSACSLCHHRSRSMVRTCHDPRSPKCSSAVGSTQKRALFRMSANALNDANIISAPMAHQYADYVITESDASYFSSYTFSGGGECDPKVCLVTKFLPL